MPPLIDSVLVCLPRYCTNEFRSEQNGRYIADDIFIYIFPWMEIRFIQISQYSVTEGSIDNISVLVHGMVWCRLDGKPLPVPKLTKCFDAIRRHQAEMSQMNQTGYTRTRCNSLLCSLKRNHRESPLSEDGDHKY